MQSKLLYIIIDDEMDVMKQTNDEKKGEVKSNDRIVYTND